MAGRRWHIAKPTETGEAQLGSATPRLWTKPLDIAGPKLRIDEVPGAVAWIEMAASLFRSTTAGNDGGRRGPCLAALAFDLAGSAGVGRTPGRTPEMKVKGCYISWASSRALVPCTFLIR
ncbi:hypothetical protein CIHG_07525 [Coccidioides immitis H538.4]|uniref:Uncharacterized protein n=1 Tax=Coccidioides immitis H538.4 TaxID=396776 RepID=A0A0J8RYH2_COCIT|nr:hypothetical protein CIHG_07525 [Coccidioides immitis H538.4]